MTAGYDTLHTLDLPLGNQTPDEELAVLATKNNRILVTKNSDFVLSFYLRRIPSKLLLVSTGNIDNEALLHIFISNLLGLDRAFV